jgi:hypothetical protein
LQRRTSPQHSNSETAFFKVDGSPVIFLYLHALELYLKALVLGEAICGQKRRGTRAIWDGSYFNPTIQ